MNWKLSYPWSHRSVIVSHKGWKGFPIKKQDHRKMEETLAQFAGLVVPGNSPEEVSAHTQLWVQEFLENQGISLKAYKGLSPSKWRDYPLSRVQFQLGATIQGLSDLLESLENMEKAVRIEKLGVNYRRSRENDLLVSLDLEHTLCGRT